MCTTVLSDFKKIVKFKDFPLLVSSLDDAEDAQGVYHTDITNEVAIASPSDYIYEECFQKYPLQLQWFNRHGGFDSYVFNGKHESSEELSGGIEYLDANYTLRWANRGTDVETVKVRSGFLPDAEGMTAKERFEALLNIKRAIMVEEIRGEQRIPVKVLEETFVKYRVDDKFFEIVFTIQYPTLLIQNQ